MRARGLRPLPAHPWTLAAYARWCEPRHRYPTIAGRIRAIARRHLLNCATSPDRHPTVVRTLEVIAARDKARARGADLFALDEMPGDRPASAAGPKRPRPGKPKPEADGRRGQGWRLRLTPRLVRRRP